MELVGKLLPTIFKRQMRREDARLVEILGPCWQQVAGKGISENSTPVAFVAGTLTLETNCPSWALQLRTLTEDIRAKINNFLGCPVVKNVQVQLAPNLGQREPGKPQDKFPLARATKGDAPVGAATDGSMEARVIGGMKAKVSLRGEGRLD